MSAIQSHRNHSEAVLTGIPRVNACDEDRVINTIDSDESAVVAWRWRLIEYESTARTVVRFEDLDLAVGRNGRYNSGHENDKGSELHFEMRYDRPCCAKISRRRIRKMYIELFFDFHLRRSPRPLYNYGWDSFLSQVRTMSLNWIYLI